ncbi:MAG: hypothetical protein K0R92_2820 [Lachnospiraceae bacterium]|nr:hypothetical protein [Lachnospiraceae bacterium]
MVNEIKSAIVYKLKELYSTHKRYTDNVPQNFTPPAFVVKQINQDYGKRINTKNKGRISYDILYFSDKPITAIESDCQTVQELLFREFDLVGTFRAINKNATITDNVLHFTFDINYSEMKVETVMSK